MISIIKLVAISYFEITLADAGVTGAGIQRSAAVPSPSGGGWLLAALGSTLSSSVHQAPASGILAPASGILAPAPAGPGASEPVATPAPAPVDNTVPDCIDGRCVLSQTSSSSSFVNAWRCMATTQQCCCADSPCVAEPRPHGRTPEQDEVEGLVGLPPGLRTLCAFF